jgi:hypothetical protein
LKVQFGRPIRDTLKVNELPGLGTQRIRMEANWVAAIRSHRHDGRNRTTFIVCVLLATGCFSLLPLDRSCADEYSGTGMPRPLFQSGSATPDLADMLPEISRNGLPARDHVWVTVEAVFGQVRQSNSLVGSANAPQMFRDFHAVTGSVLGGAHSGTEFLQPGLVGQQFSDDLAPGFGIRTGVRTETDGSIEFSGLWLNEMSRTWSRGVGGINAGDNFDTVRVTAAIPLYDGAAGYAVPFDQYFGIETHTDVLNMGGDFAPVGFWAGAMLFQPTLGARYFRIDEQFSFAGADSGLEYQYSQIGTPEDPQPTPPVPMFAPIQALLASESETSVVGPTIGLNISTSGKTMRFHSQTRVGWMYADSSLRLQATSQGVDFVPWLATQDRLSHDYSTAYFEQGLATDIDLGQIFRNTTFPLEPGALILRLGWSVTILSDVARPLDAVEWNGLPLAPELNERTVSWRMQTFSTGLVFQY